MGPAGSRPSMEQLVDAYATPLYRYAFRLSGCAADAEDLTQDTFCQAQMKLHQVRDLSRTKAWLFSILRNSYLHRLRAGKHEQSLPIDCLGDVPDRPPGPLPEVEPERLQLALAELPEPFRTPIILFYFEEFSYRDIAEQMELPLGTVMSRLARAKAHLRSRLCPAPQVVGDGPGRSHDGL
jgi:RNA polymerase sigma-70 factor (ECF subfamily)